MSLSPSIAVLLVPGVFQEACGSFSAATQKKEQPQQLVNWAVLYQWAQLPFVQRGYEGSGTRSLLIDWAAKPIGIPSPLRQLTV